MEDTNTTPFDEAIAQTEPNVEPANVQAGGEQAGEPVANSEPVVREPDKEARQNNWNNGRRRIEQRQSAKARIRELEAEIAELKAGKQDDYSRFRTEQLQDRVDDMRAISADAEATEFANRAAEWLGDETEQFMQDTYRYANYVNKNEPDLLRYAARDFGPILLHEWYKRMDNPQLRGQWLQMTTYEKGAVLANLYQQIADIVAQARAPRQQPTQQNVPVPSGGRQSSANMPTDDFGIALGEAINRHK